MSAERWSDRIANRICQLCGRSGPVVEPWWACWTDSGCQPMDRCRADFDLCRATAEAGGIPWPTGLVEPKRPARTEAP